LLSWPLFRRQPRRIAVSLMSDLFHEALTTATIDLVHAVIAVAHWHTFLVLTKCSRRMREYYGNSETPRRVAEEIDRLASEIFRAAALRRARLLERLHCQFLRAPEEVVVGEHLDGRSWDEMPGAAPPDE
jgi:protein gp37